ncbi:hypothetical protein LIA77_06480 [Sarocladium implicatum]|nr:hypothetical protein LIA77_06480 [Sarocladium implicatum]
MLQSRQSGQLVRLLRCAQDEHRTQPSKPRPSITSDQKHDRPTRRCIKHAASRLTKMATFDSHGCALFVDAGRIEALIPVKNAESVRVEPQLAAEWHRGFICRMLRDVRIWVDVTA